MIAPRRLWTLNTTSLLLLLALALCSPPLQRAEKLPARDSVQAEQAARAAIPPMGWNSWDSYGTTITEADVRRNARWIARRLKHYGWRYVVVDMEWFVTNPTPAGNSRSAQFSLDEYGRYTPPVNRFPSAANHAGFKPLADYIHALGLKFGLHILRGVPRQAVVQNLPIAGSPYRMAEAADTSDTCPWNPDNFGINHNHPAGQAYYNSIAHLYAEWGVDFVKADCIASRPYKGEDIRLLSQALRKTGRPILLSLSPGSAPLEKVEEMRQYAEMWRISDDVWDLWHSAVAYPQGVSDQFPRVAEWAPLSEPGHWPDADMLPLGYLGPAPGWGRARQSRLTHEEQRTLMTLWCMFRSPLMWGGNPSAADPWTVSLLTNSEVLEVDQHSLGNHVVAMTDKLVIWLAQPASGKSYYLAVFNLQDAPATAQFAWKELSLPDARYNLRDLWEHRNRGASDTLAVPLPPHGCVLYRLSP